MPWPLKEEEGDDIIGLVRCVQRQRNLALWYLYGACAIVVVPNLYEIYSQTSKRLLIKMKKLYF